MGWGMIPRPKEERELKIMNFRQIIEATIVRRAYKPWED